LILIEFFKVFFTDQSPIKSPDWNVKTCGSNRRANHASSARTPGGTDYGGIDIHIDRYQAIAIHVLADDIQAGAQVVFGSKL
jgi:hypothetical protein